MERKPGILKKLDAVRKKAAQAEAAPVTDAEREDIRVMIRGEKTDVLEAKLRNMHQQKLMPVCLLNPSHRDKVDIIVGLIADELRERRKRAAEENNV